MKRDWTGNKNSIYKTLGASNHTEKERQEDDYYATDPTAIDVLMDVEIFSYNLWEPACGQGHLSKRLLEYGHKVYSTDLIDRGYGDGILDFLRCNVVFNGDIITNPPYKFASEFVEVGMSLTRKKLALFLKLQFLEGKARKEIFKKYPPKYVYVSSSRIMCAKNGDFAGMIAGGGSAVAYGWFIWYKDWEGDTILRWIN